MYDPALAREKPTRVACDIEPLSDTCRLTVTHDGFDEENETWRRIAPGWAGVFESLKSLVETGIPLAAA